MISCDEIPWTIDSPIPQWSQLVSIIRGAYKGNLMRSQAWNTHDPMGSRGREEWTIQSSEAESSKPKVGRGVTPEDSWSQLADLAELVSGPSANADLSQHLCVPRHALVRRNHKLLRGV